MFHLTMSISISHILFVNFVPVIPVQPASTNDLFWLVSLIVSVLQLSWKGDPEYLKQLPWVVEIKMFSR